MKYIVTKMEQLPNGRFLVIAKDADTTKKKRKTLEYETSDPTSFHVGQAVRNVLEDAT